MEERKIEKRTEVREDIETGETEPKKTTNVNVGPDGSTQVQETEIVDDPVGSTIIRQEETIEKHQR